MNSRESVFKAFERFRELPDNIPVHYIKNPYEDVTYRINANELLVALGRVVIVLSTHIKHKT